MSDAPTDRNRLSVEASPYLRQHADNPVHWQPWDEAAREAAQQRDVPIFLSVGYAACHWCHVMADESFEDPRVAEVLNDRYVPIKVDREERPDVDSIYQTVAQMVTRGGGWPLSVWLTPDGRPFYVGTYFPTEPRGQMPGFLDLVTGLADTWENDREEVEKRADQWAAAIRGEVEDVEGTGEAPEPGVLQSAAGSALRSADREHGGFGTSGPKFPQTGRIHLLLRAYDRTGRDAFRDVAVEALDAMATRGLYDHVGGGFHRYCVDPAWGVPHFEKMLYDNAELPRAYLAGYQVTGEERYAEVVRETLEFVNRELAHPEGGFYSTLDAQSEAPGEGGAVEREGSQRGEGEREEGAFYTWTPAEVREAVAAGGGGDDADVGGDDLDADLFLERFGVTESGNFEGTNVLGIAETVEALAAEHGLEEAAVEARIESARRAVFEARAERPRPPRDEKVLAGWNGLAISAFAEAGLVLDPRYSDRAVEALEFVRNRLWDGERLSRRFKDGGEDDEVAVGVDGYLEDYAYLARAALDCYQATGAVDHLEFALALARAIESEFWDGERDALYFTPRDGETLLARPQELSDQSTPSSAGVAIDTLLALAHFTTDDGFEAIADAALATYGSRIDSNPLQHAALTLAADRREAGSTELTVVADHLPDGWREAIGRTYLPNRLLSVRPPDVGPWLDRLDLESAPLIWAGREATDGEPTIYACRSFTCSPPRTDVEAALEWAAEIDA